MSAFEKTGNWKSPRKVEEEIRDYKRDRFEKYMLREQSGELTRALAIAALRTELDNTALLDDDCPTQSMDINKLQEMLSNDRAFEE